MAFKDRANSQSMEVVVGQPILFTTQLCIAGGKERVRIQGRGEGIDSKNLNRDISGNKPSLV